jgi:hypothetical protein
LEKASVDQETHTFTKGFLHATAEQETVSMWKLSLRCLGLVMMVCCLQISDSAAFTPSPLRHNPQCTLRMMTVPLMDAVPPAASVFQVSPSSSLLNVYASSQRQMPPTLDTGIRSYLQQPSSLTVSLQERKIPTKEEIDQKKLTFNVIFWGGGIVAPFLATIFYFGFRFWEK